MRPTISGVNVIPFLFILVVGLAVWAVRSRREDPTSIEDKAAKTRRTTATAIFGFIVAALAFGSDITYDISHHIPLRWNKLAPLALMAGVIVYTLRRQLLQGRRLRELAEVLRSSPYHRLDFDRIEEAAAFVAALSRQL